MSAEASKLIEHGQLDEASKVLTIVLQGLRSLKGDGHPDTIGSMGTLAQTLSGLGRHEAAATLAQEAVSCARESLGARHADTRLALSNLAQVLVRCGDVTEAGDVMFEAQAAALSEAQAAGEGGVSLELQVVTSNLAQVLIRQSRLEEAEPLAREALRLSTDLLGSHHSSTLEEMQSFAAVLGRIGKDEEAEEVMRTALQRSVDALGEGHPDTLVVMSGLARLLTASGQLEEAEAMMRQDLDMSRAVHGDHHGDTLASMSNLSQLLLMRSEKEQADNGHAADNLIEAEALSREAKDVSRTLLGAEHSHTVLLSHLVDTIVDERMAASRALAAASADADDDGDHDTEYASMLLLTAWPAPGASWREAYA